MANPRKYEFITGIEASPQPDAGTPTLPNDIVTLGFLQTFFSERVKLVGTYASPIAISAATAIDPTLEADKDEYMVFVVGNGGPQVMSADPQIVAPGRAGIKLMLVGTDNTNTVETNNGDGLAQNGPCTLGAHETITYVSVDASTWQEKSRQ
jgi:hypothetical protein